MQMALMNILISPGPSPRRRLVRCESGSLFDPEVAGLKGGLSRDGKAVVGTGGGSSANPRCHNFEVATYKLSFPNQRRKES